MEINFNNIDNLNKCWEKFMDKIWSCSDLIKIAYSPSVGRIIIELSSEIKDKYTLIKKHYIKLDSIADENTLFNAVKNIFIKDIYNKVRYINKYKNININTKINFPIIKTQQKKELNIILQNEITTYLHYHLLLCIVLSDKNFLPWFYEHYIHLCFRIDKNALFYEKEYATIDFMENKLLFSEVANIRTYGYQARDEICKNPVNYIIDKLNHNNYIIAYLDEYYISIKEVYNKIHYVHQSLIYGYDMEEGVFLAVGFMKSNLLKKVKYKFDEFKKAFENATIHYKYSSPWSENSSIKLIKLKTFNKYPEFNLKTFNNKLSDYINSRGSIENVYNYYSGEIVYYGYKTYTEFIQYLKFLKKDKRKIDYRALHIFYEHKKALYKRLQFINENFKTDEIFKNLIKEYSELVYAFNAVRLNVLKSCINECKIYFDMYKLSNDSDFITHISSFVEKNVKKEKTILLKINRYLSKYLNNIRVHA